MLVGIAGAGIGGLSLAAALVARGIDVTVFERQEELRDGGAGISLWPNALGALDSMGLGDTVRSLGASLSCFQQIKRDGRVGLRVDGAAFKAVLGDDLVCVDRGEMVRALADLLPAGSIQLGRALAGYRSDGSGVTALLSDGAESRVDALVGADGANSVVAAQMAGLLRSSYSGYTAWRGISGGTGRDLPEVVSACLSGGHEFGWMPVGRGRTYWFATAWVDKAHRFPGGDQAYLADTFESWPDPVPQLIASTPEDRRLRNDIWDRATPRVWADGPVALLGDAAHPMRPHLGQGGCQALEDSAVLASCLAGGLPPATAFVRYSALRSRRAGAVVRLSRRSGITFPAGPRLKLVDRVLEAAPSRAVPAPVLRVLTPIAGYRRGRPPG